MSGIVAIVSAGEPIDRDLLKRMTGAMRFRGPDTQQVWSDGRAGLGNALLRTTFESGRERQPLSLDGSVWLTADARVDDRDTLIAQLRGKGREVSRERPDAELILHAYHAWGEGCVDHLIGDWAFILWDGPQRRLFCARDPFGVVPFYYAECADQWVLSNTLDVVRLHPSVTDRLNERNVGDYLLAGHALDMSATFFSDIHCLPPAHCLSFTPGGAPRVRRYWSPREVDPGNDQRSLTSEDVQGFLAVFEEAVRDRLRADRVAASMSGGMDSTSVAAVAYRARLKSSPPADVTAYSIGFDWLLPDHERYYAGLVAQHVGMPIRYMGAESYLLAGSLEEAWRLTPEPRFTLRPVPAMEILERVATDGGCVVLSGLGGDPAMAAPPAVGRDWNALLRVAARHPGRFARLAVNRIQRMRTRSAAPEAVPFAPAIHPDFVRRYELRHRWAEYLAELRRWDGRHQMAYSPFWAAALSSGDPEVSSLPVKVRHPFFDIRLIDYLLRMPPGPCFRNKALLRESMRGILPEPVRCRAKTALASSFFFELAARGYEPWLEELSASTDIEGYVDRDWLQKVVSDPRQLPPPLFASSVLLPLSLAFWLRERYPIRRAPDAAVGEVDAPLAE